MQKIGLFVWVRIRSIGQFLFNFVRYYVWHPHFFLAECALFFAYFWQSPYRHARLYDEDGGDVGPYGEMDFCEFEKIMTTFQIKKDSVLFDIGSGRGRVLFFAHYVLSFQTVIGIEKIPYFVETANRVRQWLQIKGCFFIEHDCTQVSAVQKTYMHQNVCCYVYLLNFSSKLIEYLSSFPQGTKIITFGEPLPKDFFTERMWMTVSCPWGKTEAFLQERK